MRQDIRQDIRIGVCLSTYGVEQEDHEQHTQASDIGTHRRRALCGRAVTFATHMLFATVYLFLGDPARVAEANDGLRARLLRQPAFRGAKQFLWKRGRGRRVAAALVCVVGELV